MLGFFSNFINSAGLRLTSSVEITASPVGSKFTNNGGDVYVWDGVTLNRFSGPVIPTATVDNAIAAHVQNQVMHQLNNIGAVTAPGAGDDFTLGYSPGSRWLNTVTGSAFVNIRNTGGAAVWVEMLSAGAVPNVVTPVVQITGAPSNVDSNPTLYGSAFATVNTYDTHKSTDWTVFDSSGTIVWSSVQDTLNLTTITIPHNVLSVSSTYSVSTRYHGYAGGQSNISIVSFTTMAVFTKWWNIRSSIPLTNVYVGTLTLMPNGDIVGTNINTGTSTGAITKVQSLYIYTPSTDTWRLGPSTRTDVIALALPNGKLFIVSAVVPASIVDLTLNTITPTSTVGMPVASVYNMHVALPNNDVVIFTDTVSFGGLGYVLGSNIITQYTYTPFTDTWVSAAVTAPLVVNSAVITGRAAYETSGTVLISGLRYLPDNSYDHTLYRYDPVAHTWVPLARPPWATGSYLSVMNRHPVLPNIFLFYGAFGGTNQYYEYDNTSDTWSAKLQPSPVVPNASTITLGANGNVYAYSSYAYSNLTFTYPNTFYELA